MEINFSQPSMVENMPFGDYAAVPALSSTVIKKLLISTADGVINPEKKDESSYPMILGRAYHTLLLEGRDKFDENFCRPFVGDENCLSTKDEYVSFAEKVGADFKKSQTKDAIAAAIDAVFDNAPFLERLKEAHIKKRISISETDYERLEYYEKKINESPIGEILKKSKKEVSFFWTENGVPCKARFDAFSEQQNFIFDLKTFSNPSGKPIEKFIPATIFYMNYHVQACFYTRAFNAFFKRKAKEEPRFYFLFAQTKAGRNLIANEIPVYNPIYAQPSGLWLDADEKVEIGIRRYREILAGLAEPDLSGFSPLYDENFPMMGF